MAPVTIRASDGDSLQRTNILHVWIVVKASPLYIHLPGAVESITQGKPGVAGVAGVTVPLTS